MIRNVIREQFQQAEFRTDLASAARALLAQPAVPLISIGATLAPAAVPTSRQHPVVVWLAVVILFIATSFFLAGWYGAERVFFQRHLEGKPVALRHLFGLVGPFRGRFIALGLLVGTVFLAFNLTAGRAIVSPQDAPSAWFAVGFCVLVVAMDFALTFVTPAVAYTTRSAVRALGIGFAVIPKTWPRSALYVLCPPLALNILNFVYPASNIGVQIALTFVLVVIGLLAKGAIAAFYLREAGSYSDDGAAYITTEREPPGNVERSGTDRVELMRSSNLVQLEAASALLTAYGVVVEIADLHGSTMLPFLPGGARLLVSRADLERSLEILRSEPASEEPEDS